jgi:hypothetical protein
MSAEARSVIEEFRSLPGAEQREVLTELVRIADFPPVGDDELASAANEVFLDYDRREQHG